MKRVSYFIFAKAFFTKMCFTNFSLEISQELLQITLNFIFKFTYLNSYLKIKFMVPIIDNQIFFIRVSYFSYLYMESKSGLIFKNISSLVNLNSQTKFEFSFKFLHIKHIRKSNLRKAIL